MKNAPGHEALAPSEPDIDENGVDRAQIREMLALTPSERLRRVQGFVEAARSRRTKPLDERTKRE